MTEIKIRELMMRNRLSIIEGELEEKIRSLEKIFKIVIPPRDASDRTCIRNYMSWLKEKIENGKFVEHSIVRVFIDHLIESTQNKINNPAAYFRHILKTTYGYPK